VRKSVREVCVWNVLGWNGLEDGGKAKGEREKEWERWNLAEKKLLRISSD